MRAYLLSKLFLKGEKMERKSRFGVLAVCVLLFTATLASGTVDFTLSSPSAGLVTIGYQAGAGEEIRGIALNVFLSDGATINPSDSFISVFPPFNTFIDYAFTIESEAPGAYVIGDGHPFALIDQAGAIKGPVSDFSISMGILDPTGNQGAAPAVVDNLITFRIFDGGAGYSTVQISADLLRGGVVGDNIYDYSFPAPLYVVIPEPATMSLLGLGGVLLRKRRTE